jgi:hypothetical protein
MRLFGGFPFGTLGICSINATWSSCEQSLASRDMVASSTSDRIGRKQRKKIDVATQSLPSPPEAPANKTLGNS